MLVPQVNEISWMNLFFKFNIFILLVVVFLNYVSLHSFNINYFKILKLKVFSVMI